MGIDSDRMIASMSIDQFYFLYFGTESVGANGLSCVIFCSGIECQCHFDCIAMNFGNGSNVDVYFFKFQQGKVE